MTQLLSARAGVLSICSDAEARLTAPSRALPLALSVLALGLAPTAIAGDPVPGELLTLGCSALESNLGPITSALAVHADGDGRIDVLAHVGGDIVYVSAPDPEQYSSSLGLVGVTAMASVPRGDGVATAIVVASATGLEFIQRHPGVSRAFVPLRKSIGSSAWAHANSLVSIDLDGDGDLDIAGLDAAGTTLLRAEQVSAETFVELAGVSVAGPLRSLTSATWAGATPVLAAAQASPGLPDDACVLLGLDGVLFRSIVPGGSIDDLASVPLSGSFDDALAILTEGYLTVARSGGLLELPLDLTSVAPSRLGVADLDGDGGHELLLNSTVVGEVTVLWNQYAATLGGMTFGFGGQQDSMSIDLGTGGADLNGQQCPPIGADFDRDGDVDVFQFLEAERSARLRRSPEQDEWLQKPTLVSSEWLIDATGQGSSGVSLIVAVPPMPGGAAPAFVEVLMSASEVDASTAEPERYRATLFEPLLGLQAGDTIGLWLPFEGALGAKASLTIRCFSGDAVTGEIERAGVDAAYGFVETFDELRGTVNGYEGGIRSLNDPRGTPPPRPPVPVGS